MLTHTNSVRMAETMSDLASDTAIKNILDKKQALVNKRRHAATSVQKMFRTFKAKERVNLLRQNVMAIKVQKIIRQRQFRHQIYVLKQVMMAKEKVRMGAEDAFVAKGVKAVTFIANEFSRTEFWRKKVLQLVSSILHHLAGVRSR